MLCLALRTLDAVRLGNVDGWLDADDAEKSVAELTLVLEHDVHVVRVVFWTELYVDVEGVNIVHAINGDEVLCLELRELKEYALNL